jgi:V8-like Glu-specific endopeptidase
VGHFLTAPAAPAVPRLIVDGPAVRPFQGSLADDEAPKPVCHVDVNCAPSNWRKVAKAVAIMYTYAGETEEGETIWQTCTGTLLANAKGSQRPYFLTANHCVATNQQARDTVVVWNYESIGCDGPPLVLGLVQQRVAGLLATGDRPKGDYSLLLLEGRAVPGTVLAGWTTAEPRVGSALVGIHHPNFSWKRISGGNRYPDQGFGPQLPAESYYQIRWQAGHTEGGSSGSGLFNESGQLVGTLFGGDSYCNYGQDLYGRFRVYFGQLRRWLVDDQL